MKKVIKVALLMCFVTSLGFCQKLKVTGGVDFMTINYATTIEPVDIPTDDFPTTDEPTDTDLPAKSSKSKSTSSLNSSSVSSLDFSDTSSETGFYLGLALSEIDLSEKFELQPELRFVGVKDFNQIQVPVLLAYKISETFKVVAGPNLAFLLDTNDGMKSTNFAIDFGVSYDISEALSLGARYDWGQTNLLEGGDSDNYLKINNIQIGIAYSLGK